MTLATATARLVPRDSSQGLKEHYELGDSTTIGRHPSNRIVIGLDSVSRFHARIDKRGSFYILQDLNSSNGTMVNGERIAQMTLHHNDEVTFGNIEFLFQNEASSHLAGSDFEPGGMSIVELREDAEDESRPEPQSVLRSEDISSLRDKSSFYARLREHRGERVDPAVLVRVNTRLSTLYALSEMLRTSEEDREETIVQRALDLLFEAVTADRGVVMVRSIPDARDLEVAAVKYRDEPIHNRPVSISRTILDQVLNQKVAILSRDTMMDERFGATDSIVANKIHSAICVPMIQRDRVMGVLHMDTASAKSFEQDDLEFVTIVAGELALALENMRMRREAVHRARLAAVGETVAGISHNIKNILLLMKGGSELLDRAMTRKDIEAAGESWGVVSRGIDKIAKLVRDMLEYSSDRKPRLRKVDINEMICSIAEESEDELIRKGVTLELDLEEDLSPQVTDEQNMQRCLANLIVNSIEAITHSSGRIVVSTHTIPDDEEGMLMIRVADNGNGIPRDKLDRIFLPFYTTKGSGGTGLGLPMCKKTVEDLGGTLTVESEENVGTTFIIKLPRITEEAGGTAGSETGEGD